MDDTFIKELFRRKNENKGKAGSPNVIGFDAYFGIPVIEKERFAVKAKFVGFTVNGGVVGEIIEISLPAKPELNDTFFFEGGRRITKLIYDSDKITEIEIHPNE